MSIEIQKPELVERMNAHIQTGQFHDADDLIEKALDALDEKVVPPAPAERRRAAGRKSLAQLFADSPFKGLDIDFERDSDYGRDLTL
jgi:Arc/MetJ-type ribon-helix-helix transcriptional regulator